jgi:serine/threonine-protein kinase
MISERWQHIERLFHSALERTPAECSAFLAETCEGDERLRGEVESLISAHDSAGDFLETPAFEIEAESLAGRATLVAGQTLSHYRILDLVGEGGMGEVYLAEDTRLGRRVALKLLTGYLHKDERRLRRFEREARAAAALSHPNVCVIHEVDETEDGYHFITMEYVEGTTLRQRIGPERMSLEEALDTAMQVASALVAAHAAGIVHRDIKPENIMLRPDGCIKVLDFGVAKLTERESAFLDAKATTKVPVKTEPGMIIGTVGYMSPEQVRGSLEVDARTDIWSLGVLLYEMVTARLPFEGATPSHTMVAITDQEPPPLSRYVQDVPEALEQIVKCALAKDTEARYQTAREMLVELKTLQQRIDAGTELDHYMGPESAGSGGATRSLDGRRQTADGVVLSSAGRLGEAETTHAVSSAEYLVTQIKRYQRGVALAVGAVVITVVGLAYSYFATGGASGTSLAILPFVNASADPNMEYLSDGITESLINSLSQLPQLRVTPRTTVFRYKGEADPLEIGRNLKVNAVLTGKVLQHGDMLVIQVDLVDTADESQIWREQFPRKLSDIIAVQKTVSREISEKLRLRISGEDEQQVVKGYPENADAYHLYLKGRYVWNQRTETGLKQGIKYFQQAIEHDSHYALAYSGLADSYTTLGYLSSLAPRDSFPQAKEKATRALELDETLAEAHTSLAYAKLYYDRDWDGAEREFKQAIARDPNYATAHHWYSVYLTAMERHPEALAEIERAHELDPLSLIINTDMGFESYYSGRYDQAIKQLQSVLEMNENFPLAHFWLGRTYQQQARYEEAVAEYQKAEAGLPNWVPAKAALGNAYGRWGKEAEARRILDELHELGKVKGRYITPYARGLVYAALGEKDQAFAALNEAYDERSHWLVWLKLDLRWGDMRTDPRFAELVRRIGLPK